MAGIIVHASTPSEVSLANSVTKTILQVKTALNHRIKILGLSISFKGNVASDAPVLVKLMRQTDAGTASQISAGNLGKNDPFQTETIQTSVYHNFSAEPSQETLLYEIEVHPQGAWQMIYPFGQEIIVPGSTNSVDYRFAIKVITPSSFTTTNCVANIDFEE